MITLNRTLAFIDKFYKICYTFYDKGCSFISCKKISHPWSATLEYVAEERKVMKNIDNPRGRIFVFVALIILTSFTLLFMAGCSATSSPEEEYWSAKNSLTCAAGETLKCLNTGVTDAVEASNGKLSKDSFISISYPSHYETVLTATILFEDGAVEHYDIQLNAYGCGNAVLFDSIMSNSKDQDAFNHPDVINVTKEWFISTGNANAWVPDEVPEFGKCYAQTFFETVQFVIAPDNIINIIPIANA